MRKLYKLLMSVIFITASLALAAYLVYRFLILGGGLSPGATELHLKQTLDKSELQYRFSYSGEKNRNQVIHLNKGQAVFKISYKGNGNFIAELKRTDGTPVTVLYSVNLNSFGSYSDIKTLNIPEDNPYILSITSDGSWDIAYN